MTRRFVTIVTAVVLLGVVTLAYVWYAQKNTPVTSANTGIQNPNSQDPGASSTLATNVPVGKVDGNQFVSNRLGFSFELPAGYKAGGYQDEASVQTIIVQPASGDAKQSFQIFINPFDEKVILTPQRIQSDLPGTEVSVAQAIILDNKAKGIMFTSNNSAFGGKSFEIWFVYAGNLYQITSYTEFSKQLQAIIGTWKFK